MRHLALLAALGCACATPEQQTSTTGTAPQGTALDGFAGASAPDPVRAATTATRPDAYVTEVPGGHVYGRLLDHRELGADHVVEFYEFAPDIYGARELLPVDSGDRPVLGSAGMVETYRAVMGNAHDPEVLEALVAAQQRIDAKADLGAPAVAGPVEHGVISHTDSDAEAGVGKVAQALAAPCSEDYYGDNWGAQWFLTYACNEGNFRDCNVGLQNRSVEGQSSTSHVKAMVGDYNNTGYFNGDLWLTDGECHNSWFDPICTMHYEWQTGWSYALQPRVVAHQVIWNARFRSFAEDPCGHLHHGHMWH